MIYLTGDTHGRFKRLRAFCEEAKTTKDDILIILGDAGVNYYGGSRDRSNKKFLAKLPVTIFCIHGNHEQRPDTIDTYRETTWHGGSIYMEEQYPNLLFAKDGELYELNGQRAIVIGGAYSVDKYWRLEKGYSWWPDEQPSEERKAYVEKQLAERNWTVDIVLSHTVPVKYEPVEVFLPMVDQSTVDKSTENWLGSIEERLDYQRWYAGHYHTAKKVDRLEILYENYTTL